MTIVKKYALSGCIRPDACPPQLKKKERALLMKICYRKFSNLPSALRGLWTLKMITKRIAVEADFEMLSEFIETGDFPMPQRRGRKWISNETAEKVALAVVERAFNYQYSATST